MVVAAVVTCVLAGLARGAYVQRLGGWAVTDALVIAWARQFPERVLLLYGLLALRGRELVAITVGVAIFACVTRSRMISGRAPSSIASVMNAALVAYGSR